MPPIAFIFEARIGLVMAFQRKNIYGIFDDLVHNTMLLTDPSGIFSAKFIFQEFRFSDSLGRCVGDGIDKLFYFINDRLVAGFVPK